MAVRLAPHHLHLAVQVVGAVAVSNEGTVEYAAVQREHRGQGIGRLLDARAVDLAAAMGCGRVTLAPGL